LDLLTEAKLERRFRPSGVDLASLYAAYYVAELLTELTEEYDPHRELFDLADRMLSDLADGGPVAPLVLRFELIALRILGHLPSLDRCVECGAGLESRGRVAFGPLEGGVLCRRCQPGKRQVVSVSRQVMETLRRFADEQSVAWRDDRTKSSQQGELRAVLNHYLSHLVGHRLRMHAYLGIECG
jgi:DNA repair protein RecO (recombination protein O)